MKNGPLKAVAGFTLLLAICNLAVTYLPKADAENRIYVSPSGSNFTLQASKATPLKTIQKAVDSSRPGDRIIILPGEYRERIHLWTSGSVEKPITIEAEQPGTVSIHWKDKSRLSKNQNWKSEDDNIYSISTSHPVYRASHNGESLFCMKFGNLDSLRKLIQKPNAYSALLYKNNTCYIYLKDGLNPKDEIIVTHQPVPEPREWGEFRSSNVWVEGDNWIIKGLNLEYGIGSAVRIWDGENVRVENCAFSGATFGVLTSKSLKPAKNLTIDHCLYHNFPQYDWQKNWLSWKQVYAHYSNSSLSHTSHAPTTITNSVAIHCADGLQLTSQIDSEKTIKASNNIIANCTDDAIEFDGPGCNVSVEDNLVIDSLVSLGLSPLSQGPARIVNNHFLHPTPNQEGALFKLLSPKNSNSTIQNVLVKDNLFWGNWLCWWNHETPVKNLRIENNQFFIKNKKAEPWPPNVVESNNRYNVAKSETKNPELDTEISRMIQSIRTAKDSKIVNTLKKIIRQRSGPSWWDWNKEPATMRVQTLLKKIEQQF